MKAQHAILRFAKYKAMTISRIDSHNEAYNTTNNGKETKNSNYETVLDQLYQAYAESYESDPAEISRFQGVGKLPRNTPT